MGDECYEQEFLPNAFDWSKRCELIVTTARPSLPPLGALCKHSGDRLASQTRLKLGFIFSKLTS